MKFKLAKRLALVLACVNAFPAVNAGAEPQNTPEVLIIPDPATRGDRFQRISPPIVVLGPLLTFTNIPVTPGANGLIAAVVTNAGVRITNFFLTSATNAAGAITNAVLVPATNLAGGSLTNAVPALIPGIIVPQPTGRGFPLVQPGQQPILTPPAPEVIPPLRSPTQREPMVPPLRSPGTASPPVVPALPPAGSR